MSLCKQNYQPETEQLINRQIQRELQASHDYLSMAAYFGRDSVALPGLAKYFSDAAKEVSFLCFYWFLVRSKADCLKKEREHAEKLIQYQLQRGGQVVLGEITKPEVPFFY